MSATDKLHELKDGTSCQLLTMRHTDAPEALDDALGRPGCLGRLHLFPFIEFQKCFLLRHRERLKKKKMEEKKLASGGCIQLRLSLWSHFPANVMLDCFCLSNTPLSHLFSIRAASCIPAAACNPPSVLRSRSKQHNSVCLCVNLLSKEAL